MEYDLVATHTDNFNMIMDIAGNGCSVHLGLLFSAEQLGYDSVDPV
jgi:hypothetical protein